jgi:hypothetical protein
MPPNFVVCNYHNDKCNASLEQASSEGFLFMTMPDLNVLPEGWELLPYEEFLRQRRILMSQIIHRGFKALV